MKRKILLAFLALLIIGYMTVTGFIKPTTIFVNDFEVSSDGKIMTIYVSNAGSAGYVRKVVQNKQDNKLLLDFYAAFGGFNGSIGAKNVYELKLNDDIDTISIYRGPNKYQDVLVKDVKGNFIFLKNN